MEIELNEHQNSLHTTAARFNHRCVITRIGRFSESLVAAYYPTSRQSEVVRGICNQIMLLWPENARKSLAIISPQSKDGRSFVASNLAVAFSQSGLRTLLIDADLRRPSQHAIFALSANGPGLAEILAGHAQGGGIQSIAEIPNLSIFPAGSPPPNPPELLRSYRMNALLHILEAQFDVILIDTAAATPSIDAQTVAAYAGGAVLLTRRNWTRLEAAKALMHAIQTAQCPLIGAVINDF
jgi:receptor protein-tyrosine kinase